MIITIGTKNKASGTLVLLRKQITETDIQSALQHTENPFLAADTIGMIDDITGYTKNLREISKSFKGDD